MFYDLDKNTSLLKKVIEPLVFFDQFDYPLTSFEIYKYLDKRFDLKLIQEVLDSAQEKKIIAEDKGFFFLDGRKETVQIRQMRYNYYCSKLKIAKRFSRLFSFIPFVKTVALVNLLGAHNLKSHGDIDLFIITQRGRLWLSRLFCTGLAKVLNKRPTKKIKKDRICLSFYISEDNLNLNSLVLEGQESYWYYYLRGFLPLLDRDGTFSKFIEANKSFQNSSIEAPMRENLLWKKFEYFSRFIQMKIMPEELRLAMNNSEGVFVTDGVLKFHLNDKRRYFSENFKNKLNEIFSKVN